jgi:hypothetical protein
MPPPPSTSQPKPTGSFRMVKRAVTVEHRLTRLEIGMALLLSVNGYTALIMTLRMLGL